jgi:glutamate synthase domain-containing protein 3
VTRSIDLTDGNVRALNTVLQRRDGNQDQAFEVLNPMGRHAIAAGCMHGLDVQVRGHVGYYCGGMNELANITVQGNAGTGLAENMMSGSVRVTGDASQSAGATGCGGLLVIEGNASSRCGISMKGIDIVVQGSVGHNSAFMAQAGRLVICGDADDGLGDSIYEAQIYVRGTAHGLGVDCVEKKMTAAHVADLQALLDQAGVSAKAGDFRRYGSARTLYNFKIDNVGAY